MRWPIVALRYKVHPFVSFEPDLLSNSLICRNKCMAGLDFFPLPNRLNLMHLSPEGFWSNRWPPEYI